MANIFIFWVSLLGSLCLARARKRSFYPLIFLLIPISLLLFSGYDMRLWGLGSGLAVLMLGRMVRGKLRLPVIFDLFPLILAGALAYSFGFRIEFVTNPAGGFFYLNQLSLPLTLAWIIAVTHSLGFLGAQDNSKLILKVAVVACLAFLAIDLLQDQPLPFAISLVSATLGVLGGALFSSVNISPLSQGLGFLIALLSIAGLLKTTVSLALLAPIIILGVPLLTTNYGIAYGRQKLPALMSFFLKRGYSRDGAIFLIYLLASYLSISLVFLVKFMSFYSLGLIFGLAALGGAILLRRERLLADGFSADASKINLLGTPIDRVNLAGAVKKMEELLRKRIPSLVFTPDTTAVMMARWDRKLKDAYWKADLVTADGMGLVWASKILGAPLPERVAGIDLIYEFCRHLNEKGHQPCKLFLLGARPGVAEEAGRKLKQEFPKLQIVGMHHGYFHDDQKIIEKIRESSADILLVGMGVPKQELWIMKNKDKLNVSLMIGVGGSFDVLSGRISRAPKILQRVGLEWFYRLLQKPQRLGRNSLIPIFIFKTLLVKTLQGLR